MTTPIWQRGATAPIHIDFEAAFGVTNTSKSPVLLPYNSCDLAGSQELVTPETITGTRNPVPPFAGKIDVAGNLVVPLDCTIFGHLLRWMFGAPSSSGTTNYTHIYKVGLTQPSCTVERIFTDLTRYALYNGVMVKSATIEIQATGELTCRLALLGASRADSGTATLTTPATPTLARLQGRQVAIYEGAAQSFSALPYGTKLTINIDFGLDGETYVIAGGGQRRYMAPGIVSVSGTLSGLFEDAALLTKATDLTETGLKATIAIGANNALEIVIPELHFEEKTPAVTGNKGVLLELNYKAFVADDSDATPIKVTLKNQTAGATYGYIAP